MAKDAADSAAPEGHAPVPAARLAETPDPDRPSPPRARVLEVTHTPATQSLLESLCGSCPEIAELVRALSARKVARFTNAMSMYSARAKVAYGAAFLEARAAAAPGADQSRAQLAAELAASRRREACDLEALTNTSAIPCDRRHKGRLAALSVALAALSGSDRDDSAGSRLPDPAPIGPGALVPFPHTSHMCLAALGAGWELHECLQIWAQVDLGSFSKNGKTFFPGPRTPQSQPPVWSTLEVRSLLLAPGESPVHVYMSHGAIVAITSSHPLRLSAQVRPVTPVGLHDLPAFIALPRDELGRPIIPRSRVTALVEAQEAWHCELGQLDQLSSTIVRGMLIMPKIATPSQCKSLPNHPSWEDDPAAQAALGPIIAKWLAQGVLEYVHWDDRRPVLLQPCGAVPKGTAPFYRLITDARFGNTMYSDWGVAYTSASDLSAALHFRDFTWSADLEDAYHLSVFAGCGGVLRPCRRPVVAGDGSVSWIDGYVVGCTPATCLGGCDKDMSGISMHGHIFRFAACQFGQKTAGSPLNCLVMSVARYFARLPNPVHVAAWVDDLHFSMRTPAHPACAGHAGGCPTCTTAYNAAVAMEAVWRAKAAACNLPLSSGKGHTVAQGGAFTGVHVDTWLCQYTMLADKLESLGETITGLSVEIQTTPRLLARGRGRASHYGCAIQYLTAVCPSLSQAIHQAETAFCLPPPSITEEQKDAHFDWDLDLAVSSRTRAALQLMSRIVADYGTAGRPIWPVPPASLFGSFCAGKLRAPVLATVVFLVHAGPAGWAASLRHSADGINAPAEMLLGPWTHCRALLNADWMAGCVCDSRGAPAEPTHAAALAILLALHEASRRWDLRSVTLLIRAPSAAALRALERGSSTDPALQDIVCLFTAACVDLRLSQPLFLLAPVTAHEELPTQAVLARLAADSATPRLRRIIHRLASKAGLRITLDLFASAGNAWGPRYFSEIREVGAEGQDAFTQSSWASSVCPECQSARPEFVLLYPPFPLIREALARARADQAHGILVVPYAASSPWWHSAMTASLTRVGPIQRAIRIPCSPLFVANQTNPAGHSLAVLHFDFWQDPTPRPRPCLHAHAPRPAGHRLPTCDPPDLLALRQALALLAHGSGS